MTSQSQDYATSAYEHWGRECGVCGSIIGLQVDHIDGDHSNNQVDNLMVLCASCHQEKTQGRLSIDPTTREVTLGTSPYFNLAATATNPPARIARQVEQFYAGVPAVPERADSAKLLLSQDSAGGVYFLDCHLTSEDIALRLDSRTRLRVLDVESGDDMPDEPTADSEEGEQEESQQYSEFGFNREIQEGNRIFQKMVEDAGSGRSFLGIVLEWDQNYGPEEQPLKILGGQHRCEAVRRAFEADEGSSQVHSVRVHFGLSAEQQAAIIDIYNANIDVPKALWDRIGEQLLGGHSLAWAQRVGLLEADDNFSDRVSLSRPLTVQVVRCFAVNYFRGRSRELPFEGDDAVFLTDVDIVKTGLVETNEEYQALARNPATWQGEGFENAGREFARLNRRQREICQSSPGLGRFQNKAVTPAVAAGWGYAAGILSRHDDRMALLFRLGTDHDGRTSPDPLNGRLLADYHHSRYIATYRGLGTRQTRAEAQKLAYVFLAHANPSTTRRCLSREILDYAVGEYYRLLGRLEQQEEEVRQEERRRRLERRR